MSTGVVTVERRIAARPETVFSFFTDREKWLSWMGKDGEFSFEPGGAYRTNVTGENVAEGRFVVVDPPKRLVFTWGWAEGGMPVPPGSTTVEITLEPVTDGTLLRLDDQFQGVSDRRRSGSVGRPARWRRCAISRP
ncbi:SRPBCC domain-containing protein, partial [Streptomyces sp. NPDC005065]